MSVKPEIRTGAVFVLTSVITRAFAIITVDALDNSINHFYIRIKLPPFRTVSYRFFYRHTLLINFTSVNANSNSTCLN